MARAWSYLPWDLEVHVTPLGASKICSSPQRAFSVIL